VCIVISEDRLAVLVAEQCLPRMIILPPHEHSGGETVVVRCVPGIKVDSKHRLEGGSLNTRCQLRISTGKRTPLVMFGAVRGDKG
jgi:hypothetical protein